jgi:hypothetical protein
MLPSVTLTTYLGSFTKRWLTIYAGTGDFSGPISLMGSTSGAFVQYAAPVTSGYLLYWPSAGSAGYLKRASDGSSTWATPTASDVGADAAGTASATVASAINGSTGQWAVFNGPHSVGNAPYIPGTGNGNLTGNGVSASRQLVDASNGLVTGAHTMASSDVTGALGFTPVSGSGSTGGLAFWGSSSSLSYTVGLTATPTPSVAVKSDANGKVNDWVDGKKLMTISTITPTGAPNVSSYNGAWVTIQQESVTVPYAGTIEINGIIRAGSSSTCKARIYISSSGAQLGNTAWIDNPYGTTQVQLYGFTWANTAITYTFQLQIQGSSSPPDTCDAFADGTSFSYRLYKNAP